MAEAKTERCPYCGQPITREQLVQIYSKVEKEVAEKSRIELADRRAELETQFEVRVTREVGKREGKLEREFARLQREQLAGRKALEKEKKSFKQRTALLEKQQRRAEADLERRGKKLMEDAHRLATELAKREKVRLEIASERERSQFEKERLDWQRTRTALEKHVGDLKRRVEEETPYALQEYSEGSLLADLRQAFKEDHVERLERGQRIGDLKQTIAYRGQEVGLIVYEVKNVKAWQNSFVEQAKRHRTVHKTPHVVLVSTALPGKAKSLAVKDGILIVAPEHAVLVAGLLRDSLVNMARSKLSSSEREAKVAQLYAYLTSDDYRQRSEGVVDGVKKLRELQVSEQETHRRTWQKQEQQHKRIDDDIGEIRSKIDAILESEIPSVAVRDAKRKRRPLVAEEVATP